MPAETEIQECNNGGLRADLTLEAFAAALLAQASGASAGPQWLCMNAQARREALESVRERHADWVAGELAAAERRAIVEDSVALWTPRRQTGHIDARHPD
jgi:hypothetical protein